jgi:iron(III) transport system ATP-binding protein
LFTAGFFSELNVLPGRVADGMVDTPLGRFEANGLRDGQSASVAVRLSALDLDSVSGTVPARVVSRRFLGVVELVEFAVPGADSLVRARVRAGALAPGVRDIWVTPRQRDVLVFETDDENT